MISSSNPIFSNKIREDQSWGMAPGAADFIIGGGKESGNKLNSHIDFIVIIANPDEGGTDFSLLGSNTV